MRATRPTTSIVLLFLLLTLSGCLTSTTVFYLPNQAIQDNRIIGTYDDKHAGHRWEITRGESGKLYRATLREGEAWASYTLALFRVGEQTYFDLSPENDASMSSTPGGPPSTSMIMHHLTYQPLHLVSRIEITDQQLEIITPNSEGLGHLKQLKPERVILSEGRWLLKGTTLQLQEMLSETGDNPDVFNERIIWPRDKQRVEEQGKVHTYLCAVCGYQGTFLPRDAVDAGAAYRVRCGACGYEFRVDK